MKENSLRKSTYWIFREQDQEKKSRSSNLEKYYLQFSEEERLRRAPSSSTRKALPTPGS